MYDGKKAFLKKVHRVREEVNGGWTDQRGGGSVGSV